MLVACNGGHFLVAQWLFKVGAADDITTKDSFNLSPMFTACVRGQLRLAQWLFKVGAAEDIRIHDKLNITPFWAAYEGDNHVVVNWLIEVGAVMNPVTNQVNMKLISENDLNLHLSRTE